MASTIKRVTIVGPLPPPAGGMANQTRKLGEFLRSENVEVNIVQVNASYRPKWIGKIPVVRAFARLISYILVLRAELSKSDVIHIMANSGWSWHLFATPAIVIGRSLKKPVIVNYRGGYARAFFEKSWRSVNWSLKKVQGIVVPSPFLEEVFADFGYQAAIVPNVLDETLFYPVKKPVSAQLHVIVTRNLEAIYDVATAIRAFALIKQKYPQAKLSVAGTGPELTSLQTLVADLSLTGDVTFTGRLGPSEMAQLYQHADLMLNTSTVDNTPNSIIESLACGTPVISTNVGGIPKLVQHEHDAYLVDVANEKKIAEYACKIIENEDIRANLIENGLTTISKFYWSNVWQKLQNCYCQAIEKNES
ncbi:glycosyltransferase family 4 protein [Thalassotalea fusca]